MALAQSNAIWYVYGIVPSDLPMVSPPEGLDGAAIELEEMDGIAALVSVLDGQPYAPEVIQQNAGEVEWLSPRAVAHDRVLTWASDRGAVVPLPMFSVFSGREALHTMLRDRSSQLVSVMRRIGAGREYALRVHRVDSELMAALPSLSPRLRELASSAGAASPGQRYLLERKLEAEKKLELRAVSQRIVEEIDSALEPLALDHVRSPIPRTTDDATRGVMVLNAAYLLSPAGIERFQRMLTSLVNEHASHGFRFDFTGPWPAYHFAAERSE